MPVSLLRGTCPFKVSTHLLRTYHDMQPRRRSQLEVMNPLIKRLVFHCSVCLLMPRAGVTRPCRAKTQMQVDHLFCGGLSSSGGRGCWARGCARRCCEAVLKNLSGVALILHQAENASKIAKDMLLAELMQPTFLDDHDMTKHGSAPGGPALHHRPASGGPLPSNAKSRRPHYSIGCVLLCKKALARVLGIGKWRARRLQNGWADQRFGKRALGDPRNGDSVSYNAIYTHLWHGARACWASNLTCAQGNRETYGTRVWCIERAH